MRLTHFIKKNDKLLDRKSVLIQPKNIVNFRLSSIVYSRQLKRFHKPQHRQVS